MSQGKFVFLSYDEMRLLSICIDSWILKVRAEISERGLTGLSYEITEGGAQQLERLKHELDRLEKEKS